MFAMGIIHHVNVLEIVRHPWFMSAFLAATSAQALKFVWCWLRTGSPNARELRASGGMPSVHSALVSALAFAVGLTEGFDAPYAMIAVGLGLIVLVDAATLRRYAVELVRRGDRRSLNLARIIECYFALPPLPGMFALQMPEYQFSRLDRYEAFCKILAQ